MKKHYFIQFFACFLNRQRQSPGGVCKKGVLRNFEKFTGNHLCQSLVFKKETLALIFPVNFAKFLRTPFLTEHLP